MRSLDVWNLALLVSTATLNKSCPFYVHWILRIFHHFLAIVHEFFVPYDVVHLEEVRVNI